VVEREPVILSDAQFEALLEAADRSRQPMLRTYIIALNELGARSESEVLWLRWQDLDLKAGFVRIWSDPDAGHTTKGGKSRYVPMTPRLKEVLLEHASKYQKAEYGGQRSRWIFHHVTTRRHHKAGDKIKSLRGSLNNAVARAGLPKEFVQHDLRHRRVTTWVAAGRDIAKIQAAVGHADIRTTLRYTHLVREHLLSLVQEDETPATLTDQLRDLIAQLEKLAT
jgi:integrase